MHFDISFTSGKQAKAPSRDTLDRLVDDNSEESPLNYVKNLFPIAQWAQRCCLLNQRLMIAAAFKDLW